MWAPFVMLLSLAGLSAVPKHLYEAAAIDRAGGWYTFTRITLPLVAPLLLIAIIFRTMEAFKTFDIAYIMSTPADDRADLDPALQDGVPGVADRPVLRARLHRADHGAGDHQHLREVPEQGEGALRWPPSDRRARTLLQPPRRSPRCSSITLIFLAPIYWIASTAFKPRDLATTVPPTVFFTARDHAVRQALHQARAADASRSTRQTTTRRPGGSSASTTAASACCKVGGERAALGLSRTASSTA